MEEIEKITFTFKYRVVLRGTINDEGNYGYYITIYEEDREKADSKARDFEMHFNEVLYPKGHYRNAKHELTKEEYDSLSEAQKRLLTTHYKEKFNYVPLVPIEEKIRFIFVYKLLRNGHPEDEEMGNFIRIPEEDREKADIQASAKEFELNATLIYKGHYRDTSIDLTQDLFDKLTEVQKELLSDWNKQRFNYKKPLNDDKDL
jgi:hypothetical protein